MASPVTVAGRPALRQIAFETKDEELDRFLDVLPQVVANLRRDAGVEGL